MWFGLAMGYAYHYGLFKRIEMGAARATSIEKKWPFKIFVEKSYFITAGNAMGGTISAGAGGSSGFMGGFMNRGGSAQETEATAADNESGAAAAAGSNSANANFKSFQGKGLSIGGDPIAPPRFDSAGASATRGRSTPATRAESAASSGSDGGNKSAANRPGNALIAKLEEKKRLEALGNESALTTEDVGHDMNP